MPIDTSIYNAIQPIKLDSPVDAMGKVAQFQQMQNQNKLADLMFGEKQREIASDNVLSGLLSKGLKPEEVASGLASAGYGNKSLAYTKQQQELAKQQADMGKTKSDTAKIDYETASHQFEIAGQLASAWAQDPTITHDKIKNGLTAALYSKVISPEIYQAKLSELQTIPPDALSLNNWAKGTLAQVMKSKDSMAQIAPDANAKLSSETSRRGQDMTDNRASKHYDPQSGSIVDLNTAKATTVLDASGKPIANSDNKPLTESQAKAALFGSRMKESNAILDELDGKGTTTSIPGANAGFGVGNAITAVSSDNQQRLMQAKRDFINATLRRESGAVITPSEFENGEKQYFPQVGDSEAVIEQKRRNRVIAQRGILAEVPAKYKDIIDEITAPSQKQATQNKAAASIAEGTVSKSKSGKAIVFRNGQWEYQ